MKKILIIILCIVCLILCLVAFVMCAGMRVTGVKSLAAANIKAQSQVDNYHMDGTVDMEISLDSEELQDLLGPLDPKLPVKMTLDADAGTESAHVIADASTRILGESVTLQTTEWYMDFLNQVAYTKAGESTEWKKKIRQGEEMEFDDLAGGIATFGRTVLENATFEKSDKYYTLTLPAEKAGELVEELDLLERVDLGIADVQDIVVKSGQIKYNVDKKTRLVSSLELQDVDVRGKGTYKDVSVDLKFPINATFEFSRYNELKESEYAIPAEVTGKQEAE